MTQEEGVALEKRLDILENVVSGILIALQETASSPEVAQVYRGLLLGAIERMEEL